VPASGVVDLEDDAFERFEIGARMQTAATRAEIRREKN